ncbi:MAG TPA: hypothetical protein VK208_13645 [Pyrinomonadaceae bacterium]|nr:hypothetical protein [Pyrinomonadaceae bacterium]
MITHLQRELVMFTIQIITRDLAGRQCHRMRRFTRLTNGFSRKIEYSSNGRWRHLYVGIHQSLRWDAWSSSG